MLSAGGMPSSTNGYHHRVTDIILDVRRHKRHEQIRGAIQYDPDELLKADRLALPLPREAPIAVYGDSDDVVRDIVERLHREGYAGAAALEGGMEGWEDAGKPTEQVTQEQPVPGESAAGIRRW